MFFKFLFELCFLKICDVIKKLKNVNDEKIFIMMNEFFFIECLKNFFIKHCL